MGSGEDASTGRKEVLLVGLGLVGLLVGLLKIQLISVWLFWGSEL